MKKKEMIQHTTTLNCFANMNVLDMYLYSFLTLIETTKNV